MVVTRPLRGSRCFVLVAAAEVIVGALLWTGRRAGPVLAIVLLPIELVFWIGFALPLGPVWGLARTVLGGHRDEAPRCDEGMSGDRGGQSAVSTVLLDALHGAVHRPRHAGRLW